MFSYIDPKDPFAIASLIGLIILIILVAFLLSITARLSAKEVFEKLAANSSHRRSIRQQRCAGEDQAEGGSPDRESIPDAVAHEMESMQDKMKPSNPTRLLSVTRMASVFHNPSKRYQQLDEIDIETGTRHQRLPQWS